MQNATYENSYNELLMSAIDVEWHTFQNKEDLSSVFCSELVAESYRAMGLLNETAPATNEFTPADFTRRDTLFLKDDFFLGPLIEFTE